MTRKKPSIDWSTVVITGPPEPIRDDARGDARDDRRERVVLPLVIAKTSPSGKRLVERRGRSSPLKNLLSGASMRARSNGARLSHAQICRQLRPGLDTLGYGLSLLAAVLVNNHANRLARLAYAIGDMSDRIEHARR